MSASAPPLAATDPAAQLLAAPPADPFEPPPDDDDALFELEEEIASLSAHIDAAVHRLLTLIPAPSARRSCSTWRRA